MNAGTVNKSWENVFSVIQRSYQIDKHADFFIWLQNCITEFIPHDMLVAAWGDFAGDNQECQLNYDVASNVKGINTQMIMSASAEVNDCMMRLHQGWLNNNRRWYVLNNLKVSDANCKFKAIFPKQAHELNSLLVYGVSDLRGGNECLYVFFSKQAAFEIKNSVIGLLMPYVDHTLRRIQHLDQLGNLDKSATAINILGLSKREMEVIDWIKVGKTNHEIGLILNISQNTVKSHLKRIFQKLNVGKRAQAVALLAS